MGPMKVLYGVSDVKIVTNNFILTQLEQNSDMTHLWEVPENFWLKTCFIFSSSPYNNPSFKIFNCNTKFGNNNLFLQILCYVSSPPSSPHFSVSKVASSPSSPFCPPFSAPSYPPALLLHSATRTTARRDEPGCVQSILHNRISLPFLENNPT